MPPVPGDDLLNYAARAFASLISTRALYRIKMKFHDVHACYKSFTQPPGGLEA